MRLWDPATGKELSAARGHGWTIRDIAYAPDGKIIATAGEDSTVRYWDPATGEQLRVLDRAEYFTVRRGKQLLRVHNSEVTSTLAYSPDGRLLAIGGYTILVLDTATGKALHRLSMDGSYPTHLVFTPDSKTLASAGHEMDRTHCVRLWDVASGKLLRKLPAEKDFIRAIAVSPDGRLLASTTQDRTGTVRLWEVATGKPAREIKTHNTWTTSLAFAPCGSALAVGGSDSKVYREENVIEFWDPATGRELPPLRGMHYSVGGLAYSPDGRTLAASTGDRAVYLWEIATGQPRGRFVGHAGMIDALAFAPDGRALVTASVDTSALVWDLTGGRRSAHPLTDAQWRAAWEALGGSDAARAYRAMWTLAAAAQTGPALRERLQPIPPEAAAKISQWIKDLDSEQFPVRDQATTALEKQGHLAEPALRQALTGDPGLEVRQRVERLLGKLANPSAERLRELRALEALGHVGTPEARSLLEKLAAGPPFDRLTRDARELLERRHRQAGQGK